MGNKDEAQISEWIVLFANDSWYQKESGIEMEFNGTIYPYTEEPNLILMHYWYYRLDDRKIYICGQKNKVLDDLIGKKVVIRGKLVKMSLEGFSFTEIWPGAVRLA
jgi:hypothetical protein